MASRVHKIESLRITLRKVEETKDAACSPEDFAELSRILLQRIAELELAEAAESRSAGAISPRRAA